MNFLKNIADKAKSVTDSPVRGGASQQEGFICPLCIASFLSAEQLSSHYQESHAGGEAEIARSSPAPHNDRFGSLGLVSNGGGGGGQDEEKQIYQNQVRALQEAKSLLSSEVMSLRQQMAAASEVPGGRVLERANELAVENVGLKAAIDEVNGKREALQQRLASLEQKNADRDSRDDSAVLKQELVNVQKALDNSLKEKEQEYNKLKASYDDIFYEKQKIVDSMAKKDKELKEVQVRMEKMVDSNENSLTSESRDIQEILKSEVQILTKEVAGLKKTLGDKEAVLVTQDEEVRGLRQVVKERTAEVAELARGEQESKAALQQAQLKANTAGEQVEQLQQAAEAGRREEVRLQRSVREGEERLTELGEKFSAERAEKERLKAEGSHTAGLLAQAENHKAEQARQIVVIEASLQKKENDNERFAREKEELMAKIEAGEGVNEAIQQLTKENSILLERLQENTEVLQAKESEHNIKVKLLNSETAALQTLIEKIQGENETLGETVEENLKQIRKLEVCNAELLERQAELSGEVERRAAQTAQLERKTEQRILAADKDLKEKENLFEKLKTKCDKAEQDLLANEDMTKALDNQTKTLQKEKDDLSASNFSLQENILKDKNLIEKLQTSLNCATDQEVEMEVKLRTLEEKTVLDAENMRLLKQAKTVLQEEKLCLETLLEGKDKDCSNLTTKLSHREGRITEVEAGLQETEKKVYEMQKAIEEAVGKERNLLSSIEEKDKTIFAIEEEKSNIVISFESQATILDRLTGEKDTAEKEARRTKLELQAAEQKVCGLQSQLEREKGELSEELGELRAARELLLAQVVDLKNEVERVGVELCGERERSQATAAALNIKLQDAKQTGEKMLDNLERELAGAREGEQRARQSLAALESRLLASTADMARLAGEVEQRRGEGEAAAQARDIAISKQLELEAAVGAAGEERRGLLERCVAAEAEMDRTREATLELRRRLEDAQAALHELGRENQSIQVELVKQSGRKWKDDTDVTECCSCGAAFSLTNRKHHCRNCGNIFCKDCSAKQANMNGYKKPQRVCEACFGELGSK